MDSTQAKGSRYGEEVMNWRKMYSQHSGEQVGEEKEREQDQGRRGTELRKLGG